MRFAGLPGASAGRTPDVRIDRCLNRRFAPIDCTACRDVCPTGAISLVGQVPRIEADACVRCAACTVACPSEALTASKAPERLLRRSVEGIRAAERPAAVVLACPRGNHTVPAGEPIPIVTHGRCLAALDLDDLLALAGDGAGEVYLDDVACAQCPIGSLGTAIASGAGAANALQVLFGRPPTVRLLSERAGALTASRVEPVDGMRPRSTRRGWLRSLRDDLVQDADAARTPPAPAHHHAGGRVSERLPSHLPERHARVLARVRSWSPPVLGAAAVPEELVARCPAVPTVDGQRCSGCTLCARFCPTGALSVHPGEARAARSEAVPFELHLVASQCISCGICAVACPEQAVRLDRPVCAGDLVEPGSTPVHRGTLVPCGACGALTLAHAPAGQARCFSCRLGAGAVRPLDDGAGLLDDLARRAAAVSPVDDGSRPSSHTRGWAP